MIQTDRLILRSFRIEDAADLLEYRGAIQQHCFLDMRLSSMEEALSEITKCADDGLHCAVVLKATGKVIGEIFSEPEGTNPSSTVMDTYSPCWMLRQDYQGLGYGYEAARAYIDFLFTSRKARRVYMYTEDTNIACQRLCEKLGARKEGLFVEFVSFVDDDFGRPIYENTYQYAILRKEWARNQGF